MSLPDFAEKARIWSAIHKSNNMIVVCILCNATTRSIDIECEPVCGPAPATKLSCLVDGCMDEWMDGLMDGWMDGWID